MSIPFPRIRSTLLLVAFCLAACTTTPSSPPQSASAEASPERMVATIRNTAGSGDSELAVQPLRDSQVEDLRETAQRLEAQKQYADEAKALDQALAIVADDPALLQERAEAAVLLKDYGNAEALARRAFELGSKVGPLCRRHWATIRAMRYIARDGAGAAEANKQLAACKVPGVDRF